MSWLQVTLQHTSPYSVHHMDCGMLTGSGHCLLGSALSTCGDSYTNSVVFGLRGPNMFMCVAAQHSAWPGSHARIFFFHLPKCWRYENKVKSTCPNTFPAGGKTEVNSDGRRSIHSSVYKVPETAEHTSANLAHFWKTPLFLGGDY